MIVVGLDLSLAKTGFTIMKETGEVICSRLIKSKPSGEKPIEETRRIVNIAEEIVQTIDDHIPGEDPALVVIEGLAFMARNTSSLVQLAGLNYLVRALLAEFNWPFMIVAPTTLKKYITGKGNGDKSLMMMTVYKDYGFESLDDNVCDSYALAVCGLAALGKSITKVTKPQQEVIDLLVKQI